MKKDAVMSDLKVIARLRATKVVVSVGVWLWAVVARAGAVGKYGRLLHSQPKP